MEYFEGQIAQSSETAVKYTDLKSNFAEVVQQNNHLKAQLEDALVDIQEKNAIKVEWEQEIQNVSMKI